MVENMSSQRYELRSLRLSQAGLCSNILKLHNTLMKNLKATLSLSKIVVL